MITTVCISCKKPQTIVLKIKSITVNCDTIGISQGTSIGFKIKITNATNMPIKFWCETEFSGFYLLSDHFLNGAIKLKASDVNISFDVSCNKDQIANLYIYEIALQHEYKSIENIKLTDIKKFLSSDEYKLVYIPEENKGDLHIKYDVTKDKMFSVICF